MSIRRTLCIASLVVVPVLLWAAADALQDLKWGKGAFENAVFDFVTSEGRPHFSGNIGAAKALPAGRRAEVVTTLCGKAKAYVQSETFRKRYEAWRKDRGPQAPEAKKTLARMKAEQQKQQEEANKGMKEAEAALKMLPKEAQEQARAAFAEMRKAQGGMPKISDAQLQQAEDYRAQAAQRDYQDALQRMPPADPKALVRKALQTALAETDGLDYGAALTTEYGKKRFTNPAFEGKGDLWKKGYRAGREATEAARGFARQWLAELKIGTAKNANRPSGARKGIRDGVAPLHTGAGWHSWPVRPRMQNQSRAADGLKPRRLRSCRFAVFVPFPIHAIELRQADRRVGSFSD